MAITIDGATNTVTGLSVGGLPDDTVDSGTLADNSITLAKMAGGTDGQIITYDASGDPVAVGPGTDGQILTSTGAGSPPAFEDAAASGATLSGSTDNTVVTVTGSNAMQGEANLTFDGNDLTLGSGNLIIASGHGIDFSATSDGGGMQSELLDDYEEGTFTPVVDGDATYTRQVGRYIKIGRVVTVVCSIGINAINTSQRIYVGGLPYSASSNGWGAATPAAFYDLNQSVAALLGGVADFGGRCYFNKIMAGGVTSSSNGPDILKSSTRIDFAVTYLMN